MSGGRDRAEPRGGRADDIRRRRSSSSGRVNGPRLASHVLASCIIIGAISQPTGRQPVACLGARAATATSETTEQQQQQQQTERQMHPSLFVDTKFWVRDMEFGARPNWRGQLKPCSLGERIVIGENSATVSMGDAMDLLNDAKAPTNKAANLGGTLRGSQIREFVLARDGVLLLEEDTQTAEPNFIEFLNDTGDCLDSSALPEDQQRAHWFNFEPHPDELSWFNPANWASMLNEIEEVAQLVPESHQIPCGEDVVVFGSRREALWPIIEASERAQVLAFKVNFRASEALVGEGQHKTSSPPSPLRVSKLIIGKKSYSQVEFDQLIRLYGNNLFDFQDELSVFNGANTSNAKSQMEESSDNNNLDGRPQNVLTIDETSIQAETGDFELCLDEAGCECGNEHPTRMEIICSFNKPLEADDLPCHDPIQSAGYCNKICASSISVNMDPTKFSERFLASLLDKLMKGDSESTRQLGPDYFSEHLFLGSRRIDHNKYEITARLVPASEDVYDEVLGRDIEFAQLVKEQLEKAATKSFYGIKTVNIRSSMQWRRNNSNSIFWLSFIVILAVVITAAAKYDDDPAVLATLLSNAQVGRSSLQTTLSDHLAMLSEEPIIEDDRESMAQSEPSDSIAQQSNRPSESVALVEFEANSTTGSTHNLLEVSD